MFKKMRTTILLGAIALIPVAVIGYLIYLITGVIDKLAKQLPPRFIIHPYIDILVVAIVGLIALLVVCFVFGLLVRTQFGALSFKAIDKKLRDIIPGYEILVNLARGLTDDSLHYPPALVTLTGSGTSVLGFVMEDTGAASMTVFVPAAPLVTTGQIYVVERSQVTLLAATSADAANCIAKWGIGMAQLATNPPTAVD